MSTANAIAVKKPDVVASLQNLIEQYKPHMARLLGKHMDVEQMFQIALLALGRQPKLAECTAASVLGCVLESSRLGLQAGAGAGETWMVPFKNKWTGKLEVQLIIDYRGLVKMMKTSAGIDAVLAEPVHARDEFEYGVDGAVMFLKFKPSKGDRGPIIGYVAGTWNKENRLTAVTYRTMDEIKNNHRAKAMAKDSGPWAKEGTGDYDGMCRKTVLRLVAKFNPSDNVLRAVDLDERAERGAPQDLALLADPTAKASPEDGPTYAMPPMQDPKAAVPAEVVPVNASTAIEASEPKAKPAEAAKPETKQEGDHAIFKVEGVAKTMLGQKEVRVIRGVGHEHKYYTEDAKVADYAAAAAKDGAEVKVFYDAVNSKRWISLIERMAKA